MSAAALRFAALDEQLISSARYSYDRWGNRIAGAHFPAVKTLEDFNVDHQPSLRRDVLAHLATTTWIPASRSEYGAVSRELPQPKLSRVRRICAPW